MSGAVKVQLRAEISHDLCVGVAMCTQLAPDAFQLNTVGQAEFLPDGDWTEAALREAADQCPMSAISILAAEPEVELPD